MTSEELELELRKLDWAGFDINLWKALQGGADEMANRARDQRYGILQTDYVKPSGL